MKVLPCWLRKTGRCLSCTMLESPSSTVISSRCSYSVIRRARLTMGHCMAFLQCFRRTSPTSAALLVTSDFIAPLTPRISYPHRYLERTWSRRLVTFTLKQTSRWLWRIPNQRWGDALTRLRSFPLTALKSPTLGLKSVGDVGRALGVDSSKVWRRFLRHNLYLEKLLFVLVDVVDLDISITVKLCVANILRQMMTPVSEAIVFPQVLVIPCGIHSISLIKCVHKYDT